MSYTLIKFLYEQCVYDIEKMIELVENNDITEEEFTAKKSEILNLKTKK